VEIDDKGAPLVPGGQLIFLSPATAQSTVDSLGNSQAFASAPYPGDFLANLVGTVNGLLAGQAPTVPPYPSIVTSNDPTTPSSNASLGPYVLDATSAASTSQSQAKIGALTGDPAIASSIATSQVTENPDGSATAEANDSIQVIGISNLVQVGHVTAHAKVTIGPDGTITKSSELDLGSLTIAGIQVALTDKGLSLAGSGIPLSAAPISYLLSAAHIGLTCLPNTETAASIRSAGLAVTYTTNVPSQGQVTLTVTYGLASDSFIADSNPIESTFATVRLRTKVTKGPGSRGSRAGHGVQADRGRPGSLAGGQRPASGRLGPGRRSVPQRRPRRTHDDTGVAA
jgi:hypothetical protein